jgi:hypothetical protein
VSPPRDDSERLRNFLLGDVSDADREAIERQCMAEQSLIFDQLTVLEDELRFDYLQGRLSPADYARFERRYLSDTEGRDKLAFAQAMMLAADGTPIATAPPQPARPSRAYIMAISALALAVTGLAVTTWWQFDDGRQLKQELVKAQTGVSQTSSELAAAQEESAREQASLATVQSAAAAAKDELAREQAQLQQLQQQLQQQIAEAAAKRPTTPAHAPAPSPEPTPSTPLALTLKPGLISSGQELAKIDTNAASRGVQLSLTLPGGAGAYPMYAAALLSSDGRPVWTAAHLTRAGKAVPFMIPAGRLKRADYQVLLRGILNDGRPEDLAGYAFRVAQSQKIP